MQIQDAQDIMVHKTETGEIKLVAGRHYDSGGHWTEPLYLVAYKINNIPTDEYFNKMSEALVIFSAMKDVLDKIGKVGK